MLLLGRYCHGTDKIIMQIGIVKREISFALIYSGYGGFDRAIQAKNRIPDFEDSANRSRFRRVYSVKDAVSAIKFLVPELVIVDVDIENGQGFRVFEKHCGSLLWEEG